MRDLRRQSSISVRAVFARYDHFLPAAISRAQMLDRLCLIPLLRQIFSSWLSPSLFNCEVLDHLERLRAGCQADRDLALRVAVTCQRTLRRHNGSSA